MTRNELVRKGKFVTAAKKNYAQLAKGEYQAGEDPDGGQQFGLSVF